MDDFIIEDNSSPAKGGYVLILRLDTETEVCIGRLDTMHFLPVYYAYVGSAMNGLNQRLSRHLRKDKKLHWHIDYLLEKASVDSVIVCQSTRRIECDIAGEIGKVYSVIKSFGSSDCKCPGHLFYSPSGMSENIMKILKSAGMRPGLIRKETN